MKPVGFVRVREERKIELLVCVGSFGIVCHKRVASVFVGHQGVASVVYGPQKGGECCVWGKVGGKCRV